MSCLCADLPLLEIPQRYLASPSPLHHARTCTAISIRTCTHTALPSVLTAASCQSLLRDLQLWRRVPARSAPCPRANSPPPLITTKSTPPAVRRRARSQRVGTQRPPPPAQLRAPSEEATDVGNDLPDASALAFATTSSRKKPRKDDIDDEADTHPWQLRLASAAPVKLGEYVAVARPPLVRSLINNPCDSATPGIFSPVSPFPFPLYNVITPPKLTSSLTPLLVPPPPPLQPALIPFPPAGPFDGADLWSAALSSLGCERRLRERDNEGRGRRKKRTRVALTLTEPVCTADACPWCVRGVSCPQGHPRCHRERAAADTFVGPGHDSDRRRQARGCADTTLFHHPTHHPTHQSPVCPPVNPPCTPPRTRQVWRSPRSSSCASSPRRTPPRASAWSSACWSRGRARSWAGAVALPVAGRRRWGWWGRTSWRSTPWAGSKRRWCARERNMAAPPARILIFSPGSPPALGHPN